MTLPPLLLLAVTVAAYLAANHLYVRSGKALCFHPVMVAMLLTMSALLLCDIEYERYFAENRVLHLMLGPCVVALAIPVHEHLQRARKALPALAVSVALCGALIVLTTVFIARWLGLDASAILALVTRSVTAPVALAVGSRIGSEPGLVILIVFLTGMMGVLAAPLVFAALKIRDDAVKGFTLGLTAHTFGVARALEISPQAAAFASLGMGLTACAAAVVIPFVFELL